jgi:hypothetical protein
LLYNETPETGPCTETTQGREVKQYFRVEKFVGSADVRFCSTELRLYRLGLRPFLSQRHSYVVRPTIIYQGNLAVPLQLVIEFDGRNAVAKRQRIFDDNCR